MKDRWPGWAMVGLVAVIQVLGWLHPVIGPMVIVLTVGALAMMVQAYNETQRQFYELLEIYRRERSRT